MKLKLVVLATTVLLAGGASAAQSGAYIAARAGMSYSGIQSDTMHWGQDKDDGPDLGTTSFGSKSKTTGAGGIAVGYNLSAYAPVRIELEYLLRGNNKGDLSGYLDDITDDDNLLTQRAKARAQTALLNVYYDINTGTSLTPFVTAGIGLSHVKLSAQIEPDEEAPETLSGNKNNFAWAVGAGVAWNFNDNWSADLTARYFNAGEVKAFGAEPGSYVKGSIRGADLLVGVRYTF